MRVYLEFVSSRSKKFYELNLDNKIVYIRCGKITKIGRLFIKKFDSNLAAATFYERQVKKKIKQGYKESIQKVTQLTFFSELEILSFLYTEEEYIRSGKLPY